MFVNKKLYRLAWIKLNCNVNFVAQIHVNSRSQTLGYHKISENGYSNDNQYERCKSMNDTKLGLGRLCENPIVR